MSRLMLVLLIAALVGCSGEAPESSVVETVKAPEVLTEILPEERSTDELTTELLEILPLTAAPPVETPLVYTVVPGDTLTRIAETAGVTVTALHEANWKAIPNKDLIFPGQEVRIP